MFKHYLKLSFRNLWKNRHYSAINIAGLAISFSIALVIYLVIHYHFSFDDFRQDKDLIFRITTTTYLADDEFPNSGVPVPLSEVVKTEVPGVEESAFFHSYWTADVTVRHNDKHQQVFQEGNADRIFTDLHYFKMFPYRWLAGSRESLNNPFNVVITDKLANKYFGTMPYERILGKELIFHNDPPVKISGIVKNPDQPTELVFGAFISLSTLDDPHFEIYRGWDGVNSADQLFVKLNKGVPSATIESQLHNYEKKYVDNAGDRTYELQSLKDIHFNGKYANYHHSKADKSTLYVLAGITAFLLLLSCINFINLTTALTGTRDGEIRLRKTLGSVKTQLLLQIVLETFLIVLLASALALALLPSIFKVFSDFIPNEISPLQIMRWKNLATFLAFILTVTFISDVFIVASLSKHRRIIASKSFFITSKSLKHHGYRGLTILQFAISIFIVVVAISIQKQVWFSLHKELGFQTEAIINFHVPSEKKEILFTKIKEISGVQNVSLAADPPASWGTISGTYSFRYKDGESEIFSDVKYGDPAFINLYGIKLLFGRNMRPEDTTECLVNKAFLNAVNVSDPSQIIGSGLDNKEIVGVVEDFHMKSTYLPIKPVVIISEKAHFNKFHVKLSGGSVYTWMETIKRIEAAWHKVSDDDFSYQFYDDQIASFYNTERSMVKLLTWVSGIMMFISCLGLLGIAVFVINRRTKEVGVRKVNGAKVSEILILLNRDFVKWVTLAFVIATPVAWYVMHKWLEDFAYKTELSWWIFALAGALALGIALLTVSWQSWKAATRNPVDALRYE